MPTITINPLHLKGAAILAPTKDIRYYLNGVLLDIRPRETRTVACDGHRLVCLRHEVPENEQDQVPAKIIIPTEIAKAIKPARGLVQCVLTWPDDMKPHEAAQCTLSVLANGASVGFQSIEGKFPDYERLMPREAPSLEHGHFCLKYLSDMTKAARVAFDEGKVEAEIWPNGVAGSASVTYPGHPEFYGVVMAMRGSKQFKLPAWLAPTMPCEEPRKLRAVKAAA